MQDQNIGQISEEVKVSRLLVRIFAIILIVGVLLVIAGRIMIDAFNRDGRGIMECHGGLSHCAQLHPTGILLAWGGPVLVIGIVSAGVGLVSMLVVLFSSRR